ncbi:MAG: hypothetical protein EU518_02140 [Promethearchaeota archaeon]|nr:MAG: hypothetical protein EU518_02140 [Candidatus Lokiarchaeota archaeon]
MTILDGWELSPDRQGMFDKIMESDPVGEPIITSKLKLDKENGLIIVGENGFSWRIKAGFSTPMISMGKSKWVRWGDVDEIIPAKPEKGVIKIQMYKRDKEGNLVMKKGNPKILKWKLTVNRNKNEDKNHFINRRKDFYRLMNELHEKYKSPEPPATSDSRI